MDPLVEIPFSKWSQLKSLYEGHVDGIVAYCLLDTHMSHPDLIERYNFKVFSPYGDIANGMVAISNMYGFCQIVIHPLNVNIIEEALIKTNVIDWDDVFVASASPEVADCLDRLCKQIPVQISSKEKAYKHVLMKSVEPYKNLCCPANTYVDQLKPEHLQTIDTTWTYHSESSHKVFQDLMHNGLTYVLYSEFNQPLAWITIGYLGCLTHLYCLEQYRRKGYAEFITKYAINDQLLKFKNVLAYTVEGNSKAQKLFDKLGFERISYVYGYRQIAIHPLDVNKMEEALLKTNTIDWDDVYVASASPEVEDCLDRLCTQLPVQISDKEKAYKHYKHLLRKSAEPYKNLCGNFHYSAAKISYNLSPPLKTLNTLETFRWRLKQFLIDEQRKRDMTVSNVSFI